MVVKTLAMSVFVAIFAGGWGYWPPKSDKRPGPSIDAPIYSPQDADQIRTLERIARDQDELLAKRRRPTAPKPRPIPQEENQ